MEILLVIFLLPVLVSSQCPENCACNDGVVKCVSRDIPTDLPSSTIEFILTDSSEAEVRAGLFDGEMLPSLQKISLSGNKIKSIQSGAFSNIETLIDINLSDNQLTQLDYRTFEELNLRSLNLNRNPLLAYINESAFYETTFEELYISGCAIRYLDAGVFAHTSEILKKFYMTNNTGVLDLPEGLFANFELDEMYISDSDLPASSLVAFKGMSASILDISGNCIGDSVWDVVSYATKIQDLSLENVCTNITNMTSNIDLQSLSLEGNYIRDLSPEAFALTSTLESLILKNNLIESIPRDLGNFLENLSILDLSQNLISKISAEDFESFYRLTVLDLDDNLIQTVPEDMKKILSKLTSFKLDGNPLYCNCELQWFITWYRDLGVNDVEVKVNRCAYPDTEFTNTSLEFQCSSPVLSFDASEPSIGQPWELRCVASGDPQPNLAVYLNGDISATSDATDDRFTLNNSIALSVNQFTCKMLGNYTCLAYNPDGNQSYSIEIASNDTCNDIDEMTTTNSSPPYFSADSNSISEATGASSLPYTTGQPQSESEEPHSKGTDSYPQYLDTATESNFETTEASNDKSQTSDQPRSGNKKNPDGTKTKLIVAVVVVILVVAIIVVLIIVVLLFRKSQLKEKYDVDGRPHNMKEGQVNQAMEIDVIGQEKPPL